MESALGDLGKHNVQDAELFGPTSPDGLRSQIQELSAQESIRPRDLQQEIDQIEELREHQVSAPRLIQAHPIDHCPADVLDPLLRLGHGRDVELTDAQAIIFQIPGQSDHLEAEDQRLDATPLPLLPQKVRHVEAEGLEEQDEGHPLVVGVPLDLILANIVVPDARWFTAWFEYCMIQIANLQGG